MAPFYSWVTGVLALSGSLVTASPVKRGPVVNEPINAVSTPYGEMSYTELPNNRSQLDLYTGGVYQGTILAHENGGIGSRPFHLNVTKCVISKCLRSGWC
jgi:hypothetical protein